MNVDVHYELYANAFNFKITQEGPEDKIYDEVVPVVGEDEEGIENIPPPLSEELFDQEVFNMFNLGRALNEDDVEFLRGFVPIDDDNEPAPENIPDSTIEVGDAVYNNEWKHDGICYRRLKMNRKEPPQLFGFKQAPNALELFEAMFPKSYLEEVVLVNINKDHDEAKVTYGELIRWIGIWMLMATITGPQRHEFWQTCDVSLYNGAPFRLNDLMSRNRFNLILSHIAYNSSDSPPYRDKFWMIRDVISAWNKNMQEKFEPSWVSCLDESMSIWTNAFTCPGFMMVPRKPHPFGNKYHTICCGLSGVLYQMELVEGKDAPPERGDPEFNNTGKTVGLLLRLTKPISGTGKLVILDSGFCVLKAIIKLRKDVVFASAVIKKGSIGQKVYLVTKLKNTLRVLLLGTMTLSPVATTIQISMSLLSKTLAMLAVHHVDICYNGKNGS